MFGFEGRSCAINLELVKVSCCKFCVAYLASHLEIINVRVCTSKLILSLMSTSAESKQDMTTLPHNLCQDMDNHGNTDLALSEFHIHCVFCLFIFSSTFSLYSLSQVVSQNLSNFILPIAAQQF